MINDKALQRSTLLNQLWDIQTQHGYIRDHDVEALAEQLQTSKMDIEGVISFYHFFHRQSVGKFVVYLNNSIVSDFKGFERVKNAFEQNTGTHFNAESNSTEFSLFETPCIGLSDQEPAALINFYPFTHLNSLKVKEIIAKLKNGANPADICDEIPDNIRFVPEEDRAVIFYPYEGGRVINKLVQYQPEEILEQIKNAELRGMGGAFFPAAIKWQSCAQQQNPNKFIVCNADEGEPGTFKDRVLMNQRMGLLLDGMLTAGYATGAEQGVIYLRAEYLWLLPKMEKEIDRFREKNWLGKDIGNVRGFNFDVTIQVGAGAYVCGAETALLNSMEGKRGEPRTRYFFPTERGFLNCPTIVNNVETLCLAARIIELGVDRYQQLGTEEYNGTKLVSVSGDCHKPGIYEIEWGMTIRELLDKCEADQPAMVQISGPAGNCINSTEFDRRIAPDDLGCNGSLMVFNGQRDVMRILLNYNDFFKKESCGVCTPCRAGNYIFGKKLEKMAGGLANPEDLSALREWDQIMKMTSRCGLGRTATTAIVEALDKFPEVYEIKAEAQSELYQSFDLEKATEQYDKFKP